MVSMRALATASFFFVTTSVLAKTTPADCKHPTDVEVAAGDMMKVASAMPGSLGSASGCADPAKLKGICFYLSQKTKAPEESDYMFEYERRIAEAACIKDGEDDILAQKKVKTMWSRLEDPHLKCDMPDFEVPRGTILKYAASKNNWHFLDLVIQQYGVNLNTVDKSDNKTLLDFIQDKMMRHKGTPEEKELKRYYEILRKRGAKSRSEL